MDSWRELQKNSYISWVAKYEYEKKKRIEIEKKYEALVERIKDLAMERYYYEKLDEEWDEERIDVIGQNGNTGDHYQYELWNYASEERITEEEKQKNLKEYLAKLKGDKDETLENKQSYEIKKET